MHASIKFPGRADQRGQRDFSFDTDAQPVLTAWASMARSNPLCVFALTVGLVQPAASVAAGGPLCAAYVTTSPISVFDTATNAIVGTITPGGGDGIAIS